MQPRLPIDAATAHTAARRMRMIAQAALIAWLAMGATACASGGGDDDETAGEHRPRLPVPTQFRARLWELVHDKQWAAATDYLKGTDPALLARAASENSDIRYFVIMGFGPVMPGIEPRPRPSRTWTVPGTGDVYASEDERKYNLAAYGFAEHYNKALAQEEGGVR